MKQTGLVSLDMFLDVRHGTLRRIDKEIADALVASDLYRTRHHDNFDLLTNGQIDRQEYKDLYAKRDVETLALSMMTDFVYYMRKDMIEAADRMARGAGITSVTLDINLWPYDVLPREAKIIVRSIARYFPETIQVNPVFITPEELTPGKVSSCYDMMAWYNDEEWLTPNADALLARRIPTNVLLTPTIAPSGQLPEPDQVIKNPFSARAAIFNQFIALAHVPTEWICYNPFIRLELQNLRRRAMSLPEQPLQGET